MFGYFLALFLAASPVLTGRVTDSRGKPIPDARVRIQTDDGKTAEVVTDNHGSYRLEVNGRFRLEIQHDGYRTLRSSSALLPNVASDDIYQADVSLLAGDPRDVESVELRLEEVTDPEARGETT